MDGAGMSRLSEDGADPSLGWAITMMASLAKITVPMLLAGKSVRTPGLRSFRALVMSPQRRDPRLPDRATRIVPEPIYRYSRARCLPHWVTTSGSSQYLDIVR
jgi:hypothetical protein